ncbi:MAG: TPM domain-containing protein, partial [candidate division SR1 bacterium]|nr:TPM domain-containing protein [candidate division SR1 bacterium]
MKKIFSLCIVVASLLCFASAQSNVDPMNLPKLSQWVTDFSHTLTTSQLDELNAAAKSYQDETSNQVVAVVFPTTNDNVLQDIGMKIFTDNAIGQKDIHNGLLLS